MIKYNLPSKFNGQRLKDELKTAGIELKQNPFVEDNDLFLDVSIKDKSKIQSILDAHNGNDIILPTPTIQEKLAALGLTVEDLQALGL